MAGSSTVIPSTITGTCLSQYQQRQLLALWTTPPPRLNLNSPYVNNNGTLVHSRFQLDMRRKTEVLKYENNDTKSNGITKKEKWSTLNSIGSRRYSQSAIQNNNGAVCASERLLPTSTTACGVPGPPMMLQYDPTIPLYNYATNTSAFSILPSSMEFTFKMLSKNELTYLIDYVTTIPFDVSNNFGQPIQNNVTNDVGVLLIGTVNIQSSYVYILNTPVALWVYGFISPDIKPFISGLPSIHQNVIIHITDYTVVIKYNDYVVISNNYTNTGELQDLSFNLLNMNTDPTSDFYAIQYIGNVSKQITLSVQPTYIYTVNIVYNFQYQQLPLLIADNGGIQTGTFSNLTIDNTNIQYNCQLTSQPSLNYNTTSFVKFIPTMAFGIPDT